MGLEKPVDWVVVGVGVLLGEGMTVRVGAGVLVGVTVGVAVGSGQKAK